MALNDKQIAGMYVSQFFVICASYADQCVFPLNLLINNITNGSGVHSIEGLLKFTCHFPE